MVILDPSNLIFFITVIMPYFALFVFINGLLYRILKWVNTPKASGHFTVYISDGGGNSTLNIFQDIIWFPRMLKEEKLLWSASWIFHLSLFLTALSHYKVFQPYSYIIDSFSPGAFDLISNFLDAGASILMVGSLIVLIGRRFLGFLRQLSEPEDYLVLILILIIAITGYMTRYSTSVNLLSLRRYFVSLVNLSPSNLPTDPYFLVHYAFVMIFMIYFPLGKMTHMIGSILTSRLVRRVKK
jgi:nitrate reductase gamma subunit